MPQESYPIPMDESPTASTEPERGGWKTFPYIIGAVMGNWMPTMAVFSNLTVYLIRQFNVGEVTAAVVSNVVIGCNSIAPGIGAVVADSWLGCFTIVSASFVLCLLGMILLVLTATLPSLRPPPCSLTTCEAPTIGQLAVLYLALALCVVGTGGACFNPATLGASQFDSAADRQKFFNWYFVTTYTSSIIATTGIVYLQDNVSWGFGFGLCAALTACGLYIFVHGNGHYRHPNLGDSPFKSMAHVVISAIRKRQMDLTEGSYCYYSKLDDGDTKSTLQAPTQGFSFLNRAALDTEGEEECSAGEKRRSSCTVDQVEDLKTVLRLLPLLSTTLLMSASVGIQSTFTILQALAMDRHLGPRFQIPAGSMLVFILVTTAIFLVLLDSVIYPSLHKLTGHTATPLQKIGLSYVLIALAMAGSAVVESQRLAKQPMPVSALWLVPPLALMGMSSALQFPANMAFYYQEFPVSLRNTAAGLVVLVAGLGSYVSTGIIELARRTTGWLQDDINRSRVDYLYWVVAMLAMANFGYFLLCIRLYKNQGIPKSDEPESV